MGSEQLWIPMTSVGAATV